MKSFLVRILKLLAWFALFIITWGVLTGGIAVFLSWKNSGGIPANFDVLVTVPKEEGDGKRIERVMLANLPRYLEGLKQYSFILSGETGRADSEEHISVTYTARMIDGGRQLVEVSYFDGDRRTLSRYEATEKKVFPLSGKDSLGGYAMEGGLYGFFAAVFLFVLLAAIRLLKRRNS